MRRVRPSCAGISRVTAWESEQGFCVKAVRKPVHSVLPQPVWQSPADARPSGQNIRTVADWSSSQNNNNNAWNQRFSDGNQNNNNKNNTNSVRAVRGFTQKQNGGETRQEGKSLREIARECGIFGQSPFFGEIYAA